MSFYKMLILVCRTPTRTCLHCCQATMQSDVLIKFGQRVREERLILGLSQEQLASEAGLHRTYIGMIERAEKNLTLVNIDKIAKALGLPIRDLF